MSSRSAQGSLYPALHRLDNRGLLATEWRLSETGRDAKYYTPHQQGPRRARARARELAAAGESRERHPAHG